MGSIDRSSIGAQLGAGQSLQIIPFLLSLPIKGEQPHNALLVSACHMKKDSMFFLALNAEIGFLKYKPKEYPFKCIKKIPAIVYPPLFWLDNIFKRSCLLLLCRDHLQAVETSTKLVYFWSSALMLFLVIGRHEVFL
jgi:hypothetical protein